VVGRGGGFADFVDADAAVTDENWPQRGRLVFVADRAPEPRLVLWPGLGGGLQVLDFTFQLGDLGLRVAVRAAQYLDPIARELDRAGRLDVGRLIPQKMSDEMMLYFSGCLAEFIMKFPSNALVCGFQWHIQHIEACPVDVDKRLAKSGTPFGLRRQLHVPGRR